MRQSHRWYTANHTFDELYQRAMYELIESPEYVCSPRGMKINEVLAYHAALGDPRKRLLNSVARNVNYGFAVGEFLWYWRGAEDLESIAYYNRRMKDFSNDGKTINSAYGKRLKSPPKTRPGDDPHVDLSQWETCKRTLAKDSESRRAVMLINHPEDELVADVNGSKDVPCTLSLQFFVRNDGDLDDPRDRLHLHVLMRSNDIVWGLTYDLFSFTLFQECMMLELRRDFPAKFGKLELGEYYHTAGSLHLYENHRKMGRDILTEYAESPKWRATRKPTKGDRRINLTEAPGMEAFSLTDLSSLVVAEERLRTGEVDEISTDGFETAGAKWMVERLNEHRKKRDEESRGKAAK